MRSTALCSGSRRRSSCSPRATCRSAPRNARSSSRRASSTSREARGRGAAPFILHTMQIGFIGAGNMATALARGWGEPVLVYDAYRPRAEALVAELGGEVASSHSELAQDADVVLLAHKPAGLE